MAICDHFEPLWKQPPPSTALERVSEWRRRWPEIAARHADSEGRPPRYSFFYPQEEYRPELLEPLAEMTRLGIGDVEVHIHHDGGGEQEFVDRISGFLSSLSNRHGLLRQHEGKTVFGFIHGNWALDNARPDGRWCGLNNEITLLRQLGCYADFTMPAAPSPCQGGPVNVVFRVADDPQRPRSFATGVPVEPGGTPYGDLTLIPGPLSLDFEGRSALRPRLDTGELGAQYPPSPARVRRWLEHAPRVGDHSFLKLFAHGAQERHIQALLGGHLELLFGALHQACEAVDVKLHFGTAWELWREVEAVRLLTAADSAGQIAAPRSPIGA